MMGIPAFGLLLLSVATTLPSASAIVRSFRFVSYASGLVDAANLTLRTSTAFECGLRCLEERICSAFSVSKQLMVNTTTGSVEHECFITFGSFTWTGTENYSLFMEDIGLLQGYSLAADGKFYKLNKNALMPRNARAACMLDGGNFAVPYPKHVRDAVVQVGAAIGVVATAAYFVGITQCSSKIGEKTMWCTDEGMRFNATNKNSDTNQAWNSGEPSNSGLQVTMNGNGSWDDVNETMALMHSMCRRFNYYLESPLTGRYHKVHYEMLDAATAASVCASEGGTLANAYGPESYEALTGYRRQLRTLNSPAIPPFFLIGGTDAATEGLWLFPDGSIMDVSNNGTDPNQIWTSGFTGTSAENCLALANGGFEDVSCGAQHRFLCEIRV